MRKENKLYIIIGFLLLLIIMELFLILTLSFRLLSQEINATNSSIVPLLIILL